MPAPAYILACKEISGNIYITRLPQTISSTEPGIPDIWYFVGPGSRPSVQLYSGTEYVLTFEYLSHLFCRVVDTATWPPTSVNPVQVSGGPNPPNPFTYNIQLAADALSMKTVSSTSLGGVASFYNPPLIQFPLLFLNTGDDTYSVTISPQTGYAPQPPNGVTVYYRLYTRAFPYTGPWVLNTDWTISAVSFPWFSFPFSSVGSLRYQFSVIWGSQFEFLAPFNPNEHQGGIPGETFVTVDSNVIHPSYQDFITEQLTLKESSGTSFGYFGLRQAFDVLEAEDAISLSRSLLESGSGQAFGLFFTRQQFINEAGTDMLPVYSRSIAPNGGNSFGAFDVRT